MAARGCNSTLAEGMCIRFTRHCHIINRLLFHSTNNKGFYVRARMEQHSVKSTCSAPYNYYTPSITAAVTYKKKYIYIYLLVFVCKVLCKSISSNSEWNYTPVFILRAVNLFKITTWIRNRLVLDSKFQHRHCPDLILTIFRPKICHHVIVQSPTWSHKQAL
jgi:hypothetical protein